MKLFRIGGFTVSFGGESVPYYVPWFSCEHCEIIKNTFFTEHVWWLPL